MTGSGEATDPSSAWTDSHCHLQGRDDIDEVIGRARAAGVGQLVCIGTGAESSRQAVDLAMRHDRMAATVGLHPHDAKRLSDEWEQVVELAAHEAVVGIGEAGFDFHYMHSEPAAQEEAFRAHIALAKAVDRTLVIHTREAWDETFRVLGDEGMPSRTVFHCFTGGPREAERALETGAFLSFSGIVTFKGAADVRAAAQGVPLDRMIIETDSPYLTPEPHRGRPNEPAYVVHVGEAIADLRGMEPGEVADLTTASATEAFRLG